MKAKYERDEFFGIQELSELFGRSEETVRGWLRKGEMKNIPQWTKIGVLFRKRKGEGDVGAKGQPILVKKEDFGRWCEEHGLDAEA